MYLALTTPPPLLCTDILDFRYSFTFTFWCLSCYTPNLIASTSRDITERHQINQLHINS